MACTAHEGFLVSVYVCVLADGGGIPAASQSLAIYFGCVCSLYLKDWDRGTHRAPPGTVTQEKAADIHVTASDLAPRTLWWDARPLSRHDHVLSLLVSVAHVLKTYLGTRDEGMKVCGQ